MEAKMKLSVIAIAFLLLPIFLNCDLQALQVAVRDAGEVDPEVVLEMCRKKQQRAAEQELERINEVLMLDKSTLSMISESLKEEIVKTNNRMQEIAKETSLLIYSSKLDRDLQKALIAKVREHIPDSKTKTLETYVDSSRKLNQLADTTSQGAMILFIDDFLSLNVDQEKALAELLENDWDPVWNDTSTVEMQDSDALVESIIPLLNQEKLQEILNEQQQEILKVIDEFSAHAVLFFIGSQNENPIAQIKQDCSTVMAMRIAEMESMCGLNQRQVKILSVAQKGVINKVSQRWIHFDEVANFDVPCMDLEFDKFYSTALIQQCVSRKEWTNVVTKTLTEDQLRLYQQREDQRSRLRRRVWLNFLASSFLTDMAEIKMTYDEFARFRKMLSDELHDADNFFDVRVGFFKLEDKLFENSMAAKYWEVLKPIVHSRRKMLEQQEATLKEWLEKQAEEGDE